MAAPRLLTTAALVLLACLPQGCGNGAPESPEPAARATRAVLEDLQTRLADDGTSDVATDAADVQLLDSMASLDQLEILDDLLLDGLAAAVPDADTHFPIQGPHGAALFSLGADRGFFEFSHNEHWGISALYLYDAAMRPREFDERPILNVRGDDVSIALEPQRESFEEVEDGGWHFEDDALLGYPEAGRFRLLVDGRTYTPVFGHIHVGQGHGQAHAGEHATGPHVHGPGPQGGHVVTLGAHAAHLEIVHKANWGVLAAYLYDPAMQPREHDEVPLLNIVCDEEPLQLIPDREGWEGGEDGGWHFEDDALLGETGPARFRVTVDGKTYTPPFTFHAHGEEAGHTHDQDGS